MEAYNRARPSDEPACQTHRATRPRPEQRRSNTSGRTEGSHFEDARLGRRRSMSTKDNGRVAQPTRAVQEGPMSVGVGSDVEEKVVTRKRSIIPPNPERRYIHHDHLPVPVTTHRTRKAQSVYTDGSPTPRHPSHVQDHGSTMQLSAPVGSASDDFNGSPMQRFNIVEPALESTALGRGTERVLTDDGRVSMARDHCILDSKHKDVRERKSFILAPLQKLRAATANRPNEKSYDSSLPPFNYADDPTMPSLPHGMDKVEVVDSSSKGERTFSSTLRGRLQKVFRKASRAPTGLPAQHVESRYLHYGSGEDPYDSVLRQRVGRLEGRVSGLAGEMDEGQHDSANSRLSAAQHSDTRSRVTSWTTSNAPGTCPTSRAEFHQQSDQEARRRGTLERSDSIRSLRKASSFFGRPIMNRLRRASKAEMKGSDESQNLYSALQARIVPGRSTPSPNPCSDGKQRIAAPPPSSARSRLPSQQTVRAVATTSRRHSTPNVRSVTPEPMAYKLGICSPVPEVVSPQLTTTHDQKDRAQGSISSRDLAAKAPPPPAEYLARRAERSKNRWQSQLNDPFPAMPRVSRYVSEDNPYKLPSINDRHIQIQDASDLPHHVRVAQDITPARHEVLSPSVYSRASDGGSPSEVQPVASEGTIVTITGHEVRSYSISPPKGQVGAHQPAQTSGQWRRWLSDELSSFKKGGDFALPDALCADCGALPSEPMKNADASPPHSDLQHVGRQASASPYEARPRSTTLSLRPQTASRRSSFMNERYPMIDESRNSSARSLQSRSVSQNGNQTERAEGRPRSIAVAPSADRQAQRKAFNRQRVITGRQSLARLDAARFDGIVPAVVDVTAQLQISSEVPTGTLSGSVTGPPSLLAESRTKVASKHKSAFELRATYKNSTTGRTTPIEIKRRSINVNHLMEDDHTLQEIAAGPYASHHRSSTRKPSAMSARNGNKENSPLPDAVGMPSVSSSQWLAAGPNKAQKPSAVHPALRTRALSRCSPVRNARPGSGTRDNQYSPASSPAQKMASEWLETRSKEGTHALL